MTNTTSAVYPLMLLYRLSTYSPSSGGWFIGHATKSESDRWFDDRMALAQRFVAARPDLFQVTASGRWANEHHLIFDGEKPSLELLKIELHADAGRQGKASRPQSDYELLAAVIARGDVRGTYGSSYWSKEREIIHLLACGIDWELYRGVEDTVWSEWAGTFAESDDQVKKFGATLHCRCAEDRWEESLDFGIEPPSIARLLSALGSGSLEKIFDV